MSKNPDFLVEKFILLSVNIVNVDLKYLRGRELDSLRLQEHAREDWGQRHNVSKGFGDPTLSRETANFNLDLSYRHLVLILSKIK